MLDVADNSQFRNWKFITGSLYQAVLYLKKKFRDTPAVEDFYRAYRYVASEDRMAGYAGTIANFDFIDTLMSTPIGGFSHLKAFFEHEASLKKDSRAGRYTDPEQAQDILRDLLIWGCFDYAQQTDTRLTIQDHLDRYLNAAPVRRASGFNARSKPPEKFELFLQVNVPTDDFKFRGAVADIPHVLMKIADMQGRNMDIKCVFVDNDYKKDKVSIKIISTSGFKSLIQEMAPFADVRETRIRLGQQKAARPADGDDSETQRLSKDHDTTPVRRLKRRGKKP